MKAGLTNFRLMFISKYIFFCFFKIIQTNQFYFGLIGLAAFGLAIKIMADTVFLFAAKPAGASDSFFLVMRPVAKSFRIASPSAGTKRQNIAGVFGIGKIVGRVSRSNVSPHIFFFFWHMVLKLITQFYSKISKTVQR
jgi:hypothetical protein